MGPSIEAAHNIPLITELPHLPETQVVNSQPPYMGKGILNDFYLSIFIKSLGTFDPNKPSPPIDPSFYD